MNHLRELLDQPDVVALSVAESDTVIDEMPFGERRRFLDDIRAFGEGAMCFWLGALDEICELQVIPELCRLPYTTCWFEAEAGHVGELVVTGLLVTELSDRSVRGASFTRFGKIWHLDGAFSMRELSDGEFEVSAVDQYATIQVRHNVFAARAFLSALHCSNVKRCETVVDAKLQKARRNRGKAPLFSYWTLELNGPSSASAPRGGTHASPRVHLRRGHPRQFAPGRWTWVQPHAVGNRSAGMVHKDYSWEKTPAQAAAEGQEKSHSKVADFTGGEGGIRTHGTGLPYA